jgi:hypothetical protein
LLVGQINGMSRAILSHTEGRWPYAGVKPAPRRAGDGGKRARSPGRARSKTLTPSRAGMLGNPGGPVVTTLVWFYFSHARLRVHWAPGIPHALRGGWFLHDSGGSRRGNVEFCLQLSRLFENLNRNKSRAARMAKPLRRGDVAYATAARAELQRCIASASLANKGIGICMQMH